MKIAFICGFAWKPKGTARARAFPLATQLTKYGHEVTIFLSPYDNPEYSGKEWVTDGVRIKNIRVPNKMGCGLIALAPRLCRAVRSYAPDLIHVFKPKGFAGLAAMSLRNSRQKLVLDCDDWEGWGGWNDVVQYPWIVKEYIDVQEKWLIRGAQVITVASSVLMARVRELVGNNGNVFYVPNCLTRERVEQDEQLAQTSAAEAKKALGLPPEPLVFYAGHFDRVDDIPFFCNAVRPALEHSGAALALVGDGPELEKAKSFFSRFSVKVYFFGRLSFDKYCRVLNASDIATFPFPDNSVYRAKCSVRILDYMSFGKAILTTALGQNVEYLVHGENGFLVPPGDDIAFQHALRLLLMNPELRDRLGKGARESVRAKFVWDQKIESCLAAYVTVRGPSAAAVST